MMNIGLPMAIQKKRISAKFVFNEDGNEILEMNIEPNRF
jgi:hypothetical protein